MPAGTEAATDSQTGKGGSTEREPQNPTEEAPERAETREGGRNTTSKRKKKTTTKNQTPAPHEAPRGGRRKPTAPKLGNAATGQGPERSGALYSPWQLTATPKFAVRFMTAPRGFLSLPPGGGKGGDKPKRSAGNTVRGGPDRKGGPERSGGPPRGRD